MAVSKYDELLARDRAKNGAPLGLAGPGDAVTFRAPRGLNMAWRPSLSPYPAVVNLRGEPGSVFAVPPEHALSAVRDLAPLVAGFEWVRPPSRDLLAEQYGAFHKGRMPGWGEGKEALPALMERGKVPWRRKT